MGIKSVVVIDDVSANIEQFTKYKSELSNLSIYDKEYKKCLDLQQGEVGEFEKEY